MLDYGSMSDNPLHAHALSNLRSDDTGDIDRQLIVLTQHGLPLAPKPYHVLASQLGVDAAYIQQRFQTLQDTGVIRRIGAVPNHYRLGFRANGMSVWDVDDNAIDALGRRIGKLDFVSHAYHRPRCLPLWPYNLFAMVHGRTRDEVLRQVEQIAELLGAAQRQHDVLFSTQILKKTGLRIRSSNQVNDSTS
jgi:DNA-binding Lrp family transcriptional regulator